MDEQEQAARLAELRRRRQDAAEVLAETLMGLLIEKRTAEREGRPWPEPPPAPTPPSPKPQRVPKGPAKRMFRDATDDDLPDLRRLLTGCWVSPTDLEPADIRSRLLLEVHGEKLGAAVLEARGDIGVLRAVGVRADARLRRHGTHLVRAMMRRAYALRLGRVFAAAGTPWFLEEVGFEASPRDEVPVEILSLPGIADAPPAAFVLSQATSPGGARPPGRRSAPKTLSELLAGPPLAPAPEGTPRPTRGAGTLCREPSRSR